MKVKYHADCTEWDSQLSTILFNAMQAANKVEDKEKYANAILLLGETYLEIMKAKVEKVYDVEVTRKTRVSVAASDEDDAKKKALTDIDSDETVEVTVK
jgi:hypothetical protein